jgi:bifunctional UDP-N-acetylglucosamine pyrophosphorylase/glucosamine-1-phosphate N-acetyltransferase
VTRAHQRNVDGWVARRRPGTRTEKAAQAAAAAEAEEALANEDGAVVEGDRLEQATNPTPPTEQPRETKDAR